MIPNNNIIFEYEKYKKDLISFANRKKISINLDNPITINDKINWIKLHPTLLKSFCTDKIKLHEYSKETLGEDICIPILKIYDGNTINNLNDLPNQFVIKCNHGCQYNIIVKNKSDLNLKTANVKLNKWMNTNFAFIAGYEMQYDKIDRKIFAEKYMGNISDYKFWCFNGEPKFWVYSLGNNGQMTNHLNFYDLDYNLLELNNEIHPRDKSIHPDFPDRKIFNEMVEIATKLAAPFDFVRVDLYCIDNKIYLGELTFTPSGGWMRFGNDSKNLGSMINLNK